MWTAMVCSYLANVPSTWCAWPTLSSIKLASLRQPGCTQDPSIGTWLTLLSSGRDIQDRWITCAIYGAKCWMDHRSVRSLLKLCTAPTQCKHPKVIITSFNMAWLTYPYHYNTVWETPDEKLGASAPHTEDSSEKWCQFKKIITETAKAVSGPKKCKHQDWPDENDEWISQVLHKKKQAYMEWQNDLRSKSKADKSPKGTAWDELALVGQKGRWSAKCAQTQTTPNSSSELWRLALEPHNLDPPLYYQLIDQHWSRTRSFERTIVRTF